ncbi:MAG: carboxypeptidase regulatory-like domain-containing protein [Ruminococcus flavefaciens]|nr:carboxypeptidase regulatory-like domain-containing protein [Ruminococcus flavefaciens]
MDKNAIEQYKREMMKLYGKSTVPADESKPVTKEEPVPVVEEANETSALEPIAPEQVSSPQTYEEQHPVSEEIEDVDENAPDDTAYSVNERYPEPDLSEIKLGEERSSNPSLAEYPSEVSMGNSTGYILVNTRTGEDSSPVINASVMITAVVDGRREIIASGVTDESGVSPKFAVPAPDLIHSQSPDTLKRPYSLYDISVTADRFFNARSVDVPVFSGITSVQNFGMIPLPLMMSSNDETVTYINQEPNFPSGN